MDNLAAQFPHLSRDIESYPGKSKDAIVVIPLFGREGNAHYVPSENMLQLACYSLRSWILFSDARVHDISIKLYVENEILDRISSLLEKNSVDISSDVIVMNSEKLRGDPVTHLGKSFSMLSDSYFYDYSWVFSCDADLCIASPRRTQLRFFEKIDMFSQNSIGCYGLSTSDLQDVISKGHWYGGLLLNSTPGECILEWEKRANELLSEAELAPYINSGIGDFITCGGFFTAYPIRNLHHHRSEDLDWLIRAGRLMQDDECVISMWHQKKKEVFDISKNFDFNLAHSDTLSSLHEGTDPYLLHMANISVQDHKEILEHDMGVHL